jgi:hypothetical protein
LANSAILAATIAEGQQAPYGFAEFVIVGMARSEQGARPGLRHGAFVGMRPAVPADEWVAVPVANRRVEFGDHLDSVAPEQVARSGCRHAAVDMRPVEPAGECVAVLAASQGVELVVLVMALGRTARHGLRRAAVVDMGLAVPAGEHVAVMLRAFLRAAPLPRHACPPWPVCVLPSLARAGGPLHAMPELSERE